MDVREVLRANLLAHREITEDGCWLWTRSRYPAGYGQITYPGLGRSVLAHRAAASVWMDFDLFSPLCVLHHCDNPPCFNPEHLFIGTQVDNTADMMAKGRQRFRVSEPLLPASVISEARAQVLAGETRRQVARNLRISHTTVNRVARDIPVLRWAKKRCLHRK